MFTKLKAALARLFGLGEDEAHALITALEEDAAPLLDQFRAQLLADLASLIAEGKVDIDALAKAVAAEVTKLLAEVQPPAQPPSAS